MSPVAPCAAQIFGTKKAKSFAEEVPLTVDCTIFAGV
jgi:hypothetical protein